MSKFYRLNQALLTCSKEQIILAEDINSTGTKQFYVDTLKNLNQLYSSKTDKHFYEVLVENKPSRLFLDIESETAVVNIEKMVNDLAAILIHFLQQKNSAIVPIFEVLDSSSSAKSSFHIVCTNVYFANIYHVGAFVRTVVCVYIFNEEDYSAIDTAVYTKNRMFRVNGSTKFGSSRVLKNDKPWDALLIQTPNPVSGVFQCKEVDLSSPVSTSMHPKDLFEFDKDKEMWVSKVHNHISSAGTTNTDPLLLYPIFDWLDNTLDAQIQRDNQMLQSDGMIWIASGSKKCQIQNREHRGNHIKFRIDIGRQKVYQHCHDADCKKIRCLVPNSDRTVVGNKQILVPKACWDPWNLEWQKQVPLIEE
jgi:hypothetical protein